MLTAIFLRAKLHSVREQQDGQVEVALYSLFKVTVIVTLLVLECWNQVVVIATTIVFNKQAKLGSFVP
jgi:hypothetical protein